MKQTHQSIFIKIKPLKNPKRLTVILNWIQNLPGLGTMLSRSFILKSLSCAQKILNPVQNDRCFFSFFVFVLHLNSLIILRGFML